ncbi:MAG: N-acetylgalactosamine 6-sulfate sulfatase, partial [Akkermansiaceae bacterium]
LHRIQGKGAGNAKWELYNLAIDRGESQDVLAKEPARARKMQAGLERWLESVARSLNGEDY